MGELERLRAERDSLLRRKASRDSLDRLSRARKSEKKQINQELRALRNPKKTKGFGILRRGVGNFARASARASITVVKNLQEQGRREALAEQRRRKRR